MGQDPSKSHFHRGTYLIPPSILDVSLVMITERDVDPENAILTGDDEIDLALSPAVIAFRPGASP
jgi:hypothetical protein